MLKKILIVTIFTHFTSMLIFQILLFNNRFSSNKSTSSIEQTLLGKYAFFKPWALNYHMFCPPPRGSDELKTRISINGVYSKWENVFNNSKNNLNSAVVNYLQSLEFGLNKELLSDAKSFALNSNKLRKSNAYLRAVYIAKRFWQNQIKGFDEIDEIQIDIKVKVDPIETHLTNNSVKSGEVIFPSFILKNKK